MAFLYGNSGTRYGTITVSNYGDITSYKVVAGTVSLVSDIANVDIKSLVTLGSTVLSNSRLYKNGNVIYISLALSSVTNNDVLVSGLSNYLPFYNCIGIVVKASDGKPIAGSAWAETSTGKITYYGENVAAQCAVSMVYICS